MAKDSTEKAQHRKGWREKRAAMRAQRGDSPEKARERPSRGAQSSVKDNANRAGMGGFVSGGF